MMRNTEKEAAIKTAVRALGERLKAQVYEGSFDERLAEMFYKCFVNTAETTMQCHGDDEVFLITGESK